ncbi:MAG: DUF5675 family protein [Bdellovibrionota bacterium]
MTLRLTRKLFRADGIFSELADDAGKEIAMTLEHAYPNGQFYSPKIPNGTYLCVRGKHQLHGMLAPFETFEITGVAGHTGLLFHPGNVNQDSEGCVLTGEKIADAGQAEMVTNSRATFAKFMQRMDGLNEFPLIVTG